ncbi:hypothetical protein [Pseudofrankia saprophytica]|uniref:hypothetical protein n=1 Tax=Pseudofrankia saprophytica TaxID=298655 RepID=UPI001E6365AA|nr:hypothetical protein [Pseudofrankia saprophytica]
METIGKNDNRPETVGQLMLDGAPQILDVAGAVLSHDQLGEVADVADEAQHVVLQAPFPPTLMPIEIAVAVTDVDGAVQNLVEVQTYLPNGQPRCFDHRATTLSRWRGGLAILRGEGSGRQPPLVAGGTARGRRPRLEGCADLRRTDFRDSDLEVDDLEVDAASCGWVRGLERRHCAASRIEELLTDLGPPQRSD